MTKHNEIMRMFFIRKGFVSDQNSVTYTRVIPRYTLSLFGDLLSRQFTLICPDKVYNNQNHSSSGKNIVIKYEWHDDTDEAMFNIEKLIEDTLNKLNGE